MPLEGPYLVLGNVGAKYHIKNLVTDRDKYVHISTLKPYYENGVNAPKDVANYDHSEFEVEEILNHSGKPIKNSATKMMFLVKWKGFDHEENTWEPWKNLRDNSFLHEYLKKNNFSHVLPKRK